MAVKSQRFLLAAFILAIGALASSASAGANLAPGETRFPSGVVVRIDDAASFAEEFERKLKERFGIAPEERRGKAFEDLESTVPAERLPIKLEIIDALKHKISSICDDYIRYLVKPFARRLPPSLKEFEVDVSDLKSLRFEGKCVYKVADGSKITREDGTNLPDIALEKVQLDDGNTISIASISEENSVLLQLPLKQILIIVPFATAGTLDLAPYLTRAAQKLYSAPEYKGSIIRFLVAEKSVERDTYSLPSEMVMAFRTISGGVVFVDSLRLNQGKRLNIISISAWSSNLTKAAAAGLNNENLKNYPSEDLNRDATEVFDIVGRYAAERFKVSQVVVLEKTVPGSKSELGLPVLFKFDNGIWRIVNSN